LESRGTFYRFRKRSNNILQDSIFMSFPHYVINRAHPRGGIRAHKSGREGGRGEGGRQLQTLRSIPTLSRKIPTEAAFSLGGIIKVQTSSRTADNKIRCSSQGRIGD
jgi:hypothetical protein